MSIKAMTAVFETDGLTPREKLVLLVLADYSDADGWSYPGREKLMKRSGLSDSTVYRIISKLVEAGFLNQVRRHDENGHKTSNGYQLLPDRLGVRLTGRDTPPTRQNEGSYPSTVTGIEPSVEPSEKKKKKRGVRTEGVDHPLPADWKPNDAHATRCTEAKLDLNQQAELFRARAETYGRVAKNWNLAFTTWLIKAPAQPNVIPFPQRGGRVVEPAPVYPNAEELDRREAAAIERSKNADWKPPVYPTEVPIVGYQKLGPKR